ncbi:hypothetical protein [Desulfosporosinus acididurans]|uniref:hypothetical protein n=1 Tax=Desulfosporosinus acididurans TaxID=476652 RepID=UPI000A75724F|nr:hypothetical protein [Desulfosporosinus acididurans]
MNSLLRANQPPSGIPTPVYDYAKEERDIVFAEKRLLDRMDTWIYNELEYIGEEER